MIREEDIRVLVEENIENSDCFIVDIQVRKDNKIVILVDSDKGITIHQCAEIHRYVENSLDREIEDFELQVSSPGLDMPFKVKRQYEKNLGRLVEVITYEGMKTTGKLVGIRNEGIELLCPEKSGTGKQKKKLDKKVRFDFNHIKSTKGVIDFK